MGKTITLGKTTATTMIEALEEVRAEISRINKAAGETVFNPAATENLEFVTNIIGAKLRLTSD